MTVSTGAKIFASVITAIIIIQLAVVIFLLATQCGHDDETVTTKNPSSSGSTVTSGPVVTTNYGNETFYYPDDNTTEAEFLQEGGSCVEYGYDYTGHDINVLPAYPWTQCAKLCEDSRGCDYWTWRMDQYKCYLKTSKQGRRRLGVSISGAYGCLSDSTTQTETGSPVTSGQESLINKGMCEPFDLNACNFPHGTCAEDGFCNCDVGFFGDYCMFPEICDDEPGLLRDGDKIHLLNQYFDQSGTGPKSYLDTCGEYIVEPCNGTYHVQTTASPNRDLGSGTWEIRSVNGIGGPIRYGDKIHLINQYHPKSYLDACGDETKVGCNGEYNVQTSPIPNRDNGSGTWEISSEKCIGGPVRNGDKIHLINQHGAKSYLDTCSKYTIDKCNGTFHVQTSKNPNRGDGTGTWEIEIIFQDNEDFARFDKDADGLISPSEWIEKSVLAMNYTMINSMFGREMNEGTYNEIFNETDCDDDGNISPKELKMATEQLGDGCGGGITCPWCGIVIRTTVSVLEGTIVSALGGDCPPFFKQVCAFGYCICVFCGILCA